MYQALYRKYRPRTFDDVVGQDAITTTLKNEIISGKTSHAYLFTGSRGTGKTTCSKIFAKAVNCLHPVDGNPCGECEICRGIDDGTVLDVVEMDAASNNGVDYIRDLREEAYYAPVRAKYRVYIIDEMHMLSASAFNALLKILEEPPEHVKFILATTEVHKIAPTIMSRCQRFDFKRIDSKSVAEYLKKIAQKEQVELDDDAARLIGRCADGGMRDAMSLLDLCLSGNSHVTADVVRERAGLSGNAFVQKIVEAVYQKDTQAALGAVNEAYAMSVDMQRLCADLMTNFRNVMVCRLSKNPETLIDCMPDELRYLQETKEKFSLEKILRILSLLTQTGNRMTQTEYKKAELEMAVMKMIHEELDTSAEALLCRIEQLERRLLTGEAVPVNRPTEEKPPMPSEPQKPQEPVRQPPRQMPDSAGARKSSDWEDILDRLSQLNKPLAAALKNSAMYISGNYALIDTQNTLFAKIINENVEARTSLKRAIAEITGKTYSIGPYKRAVAEKKEEDGLSVLRRQAEKMDITINEG